MYLHFPWRLVIALALLTLNVACQTPDPSDSTELDPTVSAALKVSPQEIDGVIEHVEPGHQASVQDPSLEADEDEIEHTLKGGIPKEINASVEKWIHYFTKKQPGLFKRYMERGSQYRPIIEKILTEQGLPKDLYYMALIESGFSVRAVSSARAVGVWQFMKGTAKRYGLTVDYYADERQDPIRATIAACLYLSDLNNVFQSWYLAMAAYNAGEMRIMNAIMGGNSRDFWELVKAKKLPRETMNYIPKFLAAAIIGSNPEKYGFHDIPTLPPYEPASIEVPSPVSLKKLAKITGTPLAQLKRLNPHIKRNVTPSRTRTYKLWVPQDKIAAFETKKDEILASRLRYKRQYAKAENGNYKVRRGDSLVRIAKRHGTSVRKLKALNNLRSNRIYAGQKLVIEKYPVSYTRYRVRRGDNLQSIAKKFGLRIRELKKMNHLRGSRIYAGQLLKVRKNSG